MADFMPDRIACVPKQAWFTIHRVYHAWPCSFTIMHWNRSDKVIIGNTVCAVWVGEWTREQITGDTAIAITYATYELPGLPYTDA